jgi:hypothetical protein
MKAFKKLALVTAIAAAPFAQAELTSIDDSLLGEMTGQAGISIELDTLITIDSFTYTDTDGNDGVASDDPLLSDAGSLVISGIAFGGAVQGGGVGDVNLKDLVIDIDVDKNEGVVIQLHGTDTANSLLGVNPVDFGLHVDAITASGVTANIASNINIAGALGPIDVTINNNGVAGGADLINVEAYFEVTSGSLNVDVIGLGITNLVIGQDENPLYSATKWDGSVNNYRTEIDGVASLATTGLTAAEVADAINAAPGNSAFNQTAIALGFTDAADLIATGTPAQIAQAQSQQAGTNAATNPNNANNMAFVAIAIGSEDTVYSNLTEGTVLVDNALTVTLNSFNIDVSMDLSMGETAGVARSLGSIALDNLNMSGTTLKIYGH